MTERWREQRREKRKRKLEIRDPAGRKRGIGRVLSSEKK